MKYNKKWFPKGPIMIEAHQIEIGDALVLDDEYEFGVIDDIDKEFANNKVSKLYDENTKDEEIKPEHTKYSFYGEGDEFAITDIPYNAKFIVYRIVEPIK